MVIQRGVLNIDVLYIQTIHKQAAVYPRYESWFFI